MKFFFQVLYEVAFNFDQPWYIFCFKLRIFYYSYSIFLFGYVWFRLFQFTMIIWTLEIENMSTLLLVLWKLQDHWFSIHSFLCIFLIFWFTHEIHWACSPHKHSYLHLFMRFQHQCCNIKHLVCTSL